MWYPSLAEIWLLHSMYEYYQKEKDIKGEKAANKILDDANKMPGYDMQKKRLEEAQEEFDFKKPGLKFYDAKSIKNILGLRRRTKNPCRCFTDGRISIKKLAKFVDEKEKEEYPERKDDIEKGGMVVSYEKLYHPYSQVSHWSPNGVIRGQLNIGAALATAFQSLLIVSKCINDEYSLGVDDELNEVTDRFSQQA